MGGGVGQMSCHPQPNFNDKVLQDFIFMLNLTHRTNIPLPLLQYGRGGRAQG